MEILPFPTPEKQLLISDFDGNGSNGSTKLSWNGESINTYGANIVDTAISSSKIGTPSPQGGNAIYVKSKVPNGAYYSCGFMTSSKDLGGNYVVYLTDNSGNDLGDTLIQINKLSTVKNIFGNNIKHQDLYLNFSFLNKGTNKITLTPFFKIWEKTTNYKFKYIESSAYISNYTTTTNNQWVGVSIKLSEFLNNRDYIYDLNMISTFGMDISSNIAGPQDIEVAIDNIVLTKGAPLYH